MKYFFTLGGLGNVFFQVVKAESLKKVYVFCDFFLSPFVRKILKHTNHKHVHNELFSLKKGGGFLVPILMFDLILGKIFHKTLFSVLDTNFIKANAIVHELIYFGYFQHNVNAVNYVNASKVIKEGAYSASYDVCIHIRGGDFISSSNAETSRLTANYYRNCLDGIDIESMKNIAIVTNDLIWAQKIIKEVGLEFVDYFCKSELEDISIIRSSKIVICSNSTFVLMGALSSERVNKIVLPGFWRDKICDFEKVRVKVEFVDVL